MFLNNPLHCTQEAIFASNVILFIVIDRLGYNEFHSRPDKNYSIFCYSCVKTPAKIFRKIVMNRIGINKGQRLYRVVQFIYAIFFYILVLNFIACYITGEEKIMQKQYSCS